ncbi:hypothetical protein HY497_01795 [Candidatus Woesearchaeota archaeon]|nr:hypothetical protein [Candidatus Woesearchaeota archaeon]
MKVIQEILEAERKAEEMILLAEKEKARKIARAREKALGRITQGKKGIERRIDVQVKQQTAKFEQQKKKICDAYAAEAKIIEKKAQKNIDRAADFVMNIFMADVT